MHHCIGQRLVKQTLTQTAAGATSKESVLPLSRLLEAARRTKNRTLICIYERNFDLHSHAATRYALTNAELRRALKELGYHFEAFILKTLADSIEAWHVPHMTEVDRSRKLHFLSLMVVRLFGPALRDVTCLNAATFGGLPTKQWLHLAANGDARRHLLRSISESARDAYCEKAAMTELCESHFSSLANNSTTGLKTTVEAIQSRSPQLDMALQVKIESQLPDSSFTLRFSQRQRKLEGGAAKGWNDGTFKRTGYDKDLSTRARQHTGGRSNTSIRQMVRAMTNA
jgi:hypothetical protein